MSADAFTLTSDYVLLTCCYEGCGIQFAVPRYWEQKRRQDHTRWTCPNQHVQHFLGQTEEERLRRELQAAKEATERAERRAKFEQESRQAVERQVRAQKAATTRLRNRAAHGVCVACKRTFENVQRHMASQHPELVAPSHTR